MFVNCGMKNLVTKLLRRSRAASSSKTFFMGQYLKLLLSLVNLTDLAVKLKVKEKALQKAYFRYQEKGNISPTLKRAISYLKDLTQKVADEA